MPKALGDYGLRYLTRQSTRSLTCHPIVMVSKEGYAQRLTDQTPVQITLKATKAGNVNAMAKGLRWMVYSIDGNNKKLHKN